MPKTSTHHDRKYLKTKWGPKCDSPKGLKLRQLYSDPHKKVLVETIAYTLEVSVAAVTAAIRRYGLKRDEKFRNKPRRKAVKPGDQNPAVRKHAPEPSVAAEPLIVKPRIYGRAATLPPLPSLQQDNVTSFPCSTLPRKM